MLTTDVSHVADFKLVGIAGFDTSLFDELTIRMLARWIRQCTPRWAHWLATWGSWRWPLILAGLRIEQAVLPDGSQVLVVDGIHGGYSGQTS